MERKLTAILCADVFGYSRLMGGDEEATLVTLTAHRKIIDSLIEQRHGRFVNSAGDSVLAEFASVVDAVNCAVDIQRALKVENARLSPARRMDFRIGVNLGDVMVEGDQIYGDGINIAARLESLANPGGICISGTVHEQIRNKLALGYEDLREQTVKNIAHPVHVWRVLPDGTTPPRETRRRPRRYWRSGMLSLTGLAIVAGTIVLVQHVSLRPTRTQASIAPQEKPALPLPSIPSIAVLPFTNQSGDPNQEYFSDGIADQLISDLSRLPGLFVIARNSSFTYKGKTVTEHEIGRELGVKYVLEGSVRRTADRVRIGVELVDASTGTEMWTQRYDRPLADIFAMQDEIVGKVVTTLGLVLKLEEMNAPHEGKWQPTTSLEAFDDMLRAAQDFHRFNKDDNVSARGWLEKAIALDPTYVDAYAFLSATYKVAVLFRWSENPQADLARSYELARKALALDDSNSGALDQLCDIDWQRKRFAQAVAEGERCVAMNPSSPICYEALADALTVSNQPEAAVRAAEKAIRLDPAHQDFYAFFVANPYVLMGRYQEAIRLLKRHLTALPGNPWAYCDLVVAYIELGRDADARAAAAELMRTNPNFVLGEPNEDAGVNKRYRNDLRKAGLKNQ
ncbi:MAG: adenylate/guanylate cyclase domain-containing protein [Candidatus Binataceae bacterium]